MSPGISGVRRLTPREAKTMAAIHAECFDRPWPALDMAVHLERDLCLGVGDPLQSFVIIRSTDQDAEILTIGTAKTARRKGLARQLLSAAHDILRDTGVKTVFLEVAEDNLSAQALYRDLNYQPIGRRPAYYKRAGGRVAAITFSLLLSPTRLPE